MTTKTALFALLAMWGVGSLDMTPTFAEDITTSADLDADFADEVGDSDLTDRVWAKAASPHTPGVMRIFLSDGTMVSDSCWETHRLSPWTQVSDTELSWEEDGMPVKAEILSLTADELVLKLALRGGSVEEHYVPATPRYLRADMPKA